MPALLQPENAAQLRPVGLAGSPPASNTALAQQSEKPDAPALTAVQAVAYNDCIAITARRGVSVASITIRNLDDSLKARLRLSAARHGRSMEEEARQILRQSLLREKASRGLGSRIVQRFAAAGGVDLPEVRRSRPRRPPRLPLDDSR